VILHTDAVLEYCIDDTHYFGGDFYSYRNAPPVLHLKPGSHRIDLRLVRDGRAFGGIGEPTLDVVVDVRQASGTLELAKPGILIADVVDGKLASPVGSVYLRNSGEDDIEVIGIQPSNVSSHTSFARSSLGAQSPMAADTGTDVDNQNNHTSSGSNSSSSITLVAGQTRPIAFNISLPTHNASSVEYNITYRAPNGTHATLQVSQVLKHVSMYNPHKITFLHPGGMVSYAMLRPPAKNATCPPGHTKLPVLLQLHGAGLEADSPMVAGALDPVSDLCAWVLFPTGVTPWSGDDWHNWGFADVEAAIEAIPAWIKHVGWRGPSVNTDRWVVSGHSNGGQGTWYALTHRPDKIVAAAPVSGYASIQRYVPYELWQPADPRRTAVISASLNSYRHEMLMPNARGIPILQQHGEIDDNVPAFHSHLLAQQLYLSGASSDYVDVPGQNHWWDTVMTTAELVDFYYKQTKSEEVLPRKLVNFTIMVGDPGDMGSKNGIKVKHLEDPGQYGKVDVKAHTITTSNVQELEFDPALWKESVSLDGSQLELTGMLASSNSPIGAYKLNRHWYLITPETRTKQIQRSGRQLGSMTAILRSQGPFFIRHPGTANTSHLAIQISRNLHQYFQADTVIVSSPSYSVPVDTTGNVITLSIGSSLEDIQPAFSVRVAESGVTVRDHQGQEQQYGEEARGAAFLRPLEGEDERLDLVLWGADDEGLRQAARVVPMITGVGQPDFVVLGESAKWRGVEGALAMGFFDSRWEATPSSVVESA
jgi:acetyl esterase/lipase